MRTKSEFYTLAVKSGLYSDEGRLKFYLEKYLFQGIDFRGKNVLDIGGGSGLFSFYAAINGANRVIVMEPEIEGSTKGISKKFNEFNRILGNLDNIEFCTDTFQSYRSDLLFDVVLMHNSINHLDESACIRLGFDSVAREKYSEIFTKLNSIISRNGLLIITDCSRYNFFTLIGVKNPIAPYIEWEKHQSPETWVQLLDEAGFELIQKKWFSLNSLGTLGRFFFGNRISAYFLTSDFRILLRKKY